MNDDEETKRHMGNTMNRLKAAQQQTVCTGGEYKGPVVITHRVDKSGNNCVITNDTHNKSTNNGFSRGDQGRFFSH